MKKDFYQSPDDVASEKNHEAWMALGNCFDEMKKPQKAEECFKKALVYCSKERESDLLFNLGNSLFDQMRYEEAITVYQKVSAQSPVYAPARNNMERARKRLNT